MDASDAVREKRNYAKFTSSFFWLIILPVFILGGCADWWSNNFSHPRRLHIVPEESLWSQFEHAMSHSGLINVESARDVNWGVAFTAVTSKILGWEPDFCDLYSPAVLLIKELNPNLDGEKLKDVEKLWKEKLWNSYVSNIYFDAMSRTATANSDTELKNKLIQVRETLRKILHESRGYGYTEHGRSSFEGSTDLKQEHHQLDEIVGRLTKKPPECRLPQEKEYRGISYTLKQDTHGNNYFLTKLLRIIDRDHRGFLVPADEMRNEGIRTQIENWLATRQHEPRALTVSTSSPASLSPSIKKPESPAHAEKKTFLLQLTDAGQGALVHSAKEMILQELTRALKHPVCSADPQKCADRSIKELENLLEVLQRSQPVKEQPADYQPRQTFELRLSSILNSPDIANRLEYISTYIYFNPYPFPSNGNIDLTKEFWEQFRALHIPRSPHVRIETIEADLNAAWRRMRVRIETVDTLVEYAPLQEIATVTRESNQNLELKLQSSPNIATAGTGPVDTALTSGSHFKTAVTEKLLKELDRRSTWLNAERNLLRLTQRGMEAINISGGLKEKVTLHVPQSQTTIPTLHFQNGDIGIQELGQPMYTHVAALAITLAVIREPYEFKRSAAEKFGLPDSADSYYVMVVANPVNLTLWEWERSLTGLDATDINVSETHLPEFLEGSSQFNDEEEQARMRATKLRFFRPIDGREVELFSTASGAGEFRNILRHSLWAFAKNTKGPSDWSMTCERSKNGNGIFLFYKLNHNPSENGGRSTEHQNDTEILVIGKKNEQTARIQPFRGDENEIIRSIERSDKCTPTANGIMPR